MSTFREIDEKILALVDEDGEILDLEEFQALQMEREQKAENMALWVLDIRDEQNAIREEMRRLQARLTASERKEKTLREFLARVLDGEKLKTARITVSYRTTPAVEIDDEDRLRRWAMTDDRYEDVLRYKEPEISKNEVRRLIQEGVKVPGAQLVERVSTTIK